MKKAIVALLLTVTVRFAGAQAWLPCGGGIQESIYGMAADSVHNRLFVGGVFSFIYINQQYDTIQVHNMAIWDGHNWSKFIHDGGIDGVNNGTGTMLVWNNNLYYSYGIGANGYIKKIDLDNTNSTSSMGPLNGSIEDLVVYHDTLYACGDFTGMMSKWTGTNWVSVTSGLGSGIGLGLYDMEVYNDKIYVVGNFEITSPYVTKDVAAYNNGVWEDVGSNLVADLGNLGTYVYAIKPYHNKLYISGQFSVSDGSPADGLLVLGSDSLWTNAGITATQFGAKAMAEFNNKLYFAGTGTIPMTTYQTCMPSYNDTLWKYECYSGLCPGGGNCLEQFQGDLYLGGFFLIIQNSVDYAQNIAFLDLDTVINPVNDIGNKKIRNDITIYPNPASEKIKTEWNCIANEIELKDLLGRVILKQSVTPAERSKEINITNLNSGFYLLTVKTVTGSKTVKVVKE